MRNDIYNRSAQDPNYAGDNQLELEDALELFKQQIESVLFTPKTTVMGQLNFGASLEEFIWSFRTSSEELNYAVTNQISAYCSMAPEFTYKVSSTFYAGSIRDIAEITIEINDSTGFNILMS